ncbi:MAG: ABC transporter permease [Actinomycetota bacterium]|nr:ABC transporter permease [Actinomycetota bacterium]
MLAELPWRRDATGRTTETVGMAAQATLERLGDTPSSADYLRALWGRRQFAIAIAVGEVRSQHMNTALGNVWLVLNPLLQMGVYYLVFGVIIGTDRGVDNFLAFLAVGVFLFHYTQRSIMAGAKSLLKNQGLIRSIQFPRAVLPLATVLAHGLSFLPAAAVMIGIALVTGESLHWTWLLLVALFAVQTVFNIGMAFITARMTDRFPDMQNVLPFVFRLLFYMSGVLFLATRYVSAETLVWFQLNPVYAMISTGRGIILEGTLNGVLWLSAGGWAIFALVTGFFVFRAGERDYGRG